MRRRRKEVTWVSVEPSVEGGDGSDREEPDLVAEESEQGVDDRGDLVTDHHAIEKATDGRTDDLS